MPLSFISRLLRRPSPTLLALLAALACMAGPVRAQAQAVPEYGLKAAILYNFALFTEWPEPAAGELFNVCVNADSPMRPALDEFHDKSVKGKRLAIRALHNMENARGCHILYLDRQDRDRWAATRKNIGNDSVLSVTDDAEIGRDGAIITLGVQAGRIAFDIDTAAMRQARLALSSKLLRLARTVK